MRMQHIWLFSNSDQRQKLHYNIYADTFIKMDVGKASVLLFP